jgi:transposase
MHAAAATDPVVTAYTGGLSVRRAAAACGRSPSTAHRRIRAAQLTPHTAGEARDRRPPPAELTSGQLAVIKADYLAGRASLHDLGARYGLSGDTIGRKLRKAGVPIRPKGRTLAAARAPKPAPRPAQRPRALPPAETLADGYAASGSLRALAQQYRASEPRLRAALEDAGISTARVHPLTAAQREQIGQLAAAGTSLAEICRRTRANMATVRRAVRPRPPATVTM